MCNRSSLVHELIAFLSEKPNADRLAQFLVLQTLQPHQPRGALICAFSADGKVQAAGSFGLTVEALEALQALSLWDRAPATDAIRDGAPIVLNGMDDLRTHYPLLAKSQAVHAPLVSWPLSVGFQRIGSIQIRLFKDFDHQSLSRDLQEVSNVLGLYFAMQPLDIGNNHVNGEKIDGDLRATHNPAQRELSERQMKILEFLAQGLTNPQIAARIGFSDSTVRQETMAIYRFLGAHGRRDAVHNAHVRGLLIPEEILTGQS